MKKMLITLMFVAFPIFSQTLIWESEYLHFESLVTGLFTMIQDDDGNIICALKPSVSPAINAPFFKYSTEGELLSYRSYYVGALLLPVSLFATNSGYKILAGTADRLVGGWSKHADTFPMIIETDKNGAIVKTFVPYDASDTSIRNDYSMGVNSHINNTVAINQKFYNFCQIKKSIPSENYPGLSPLHNVAILNCFNDKGELIFRKELDTSITGSYNFDDISLKLTSKNTLLGLAHLWNATDEKSSFYLIESDTTGLILMNRKINFDYRDSPLFLTPLSNGNFVILHIPGFNNDDKSRYIMLLDSSGEKLSEKKLPWIDLYGGSYNGMIETPDNGLLLVGKTRIKNGVGQWDHTDRMFMMKLNDKYEKEWDFSWHEHFNQETSSFRNVKFIDNETFIVVGVKDRYKFWIGKFNAKPVSVSEENKHFSLSLRPNPSVDYIEIFQPSEGSVIKIYNMLGECVISDVRHLENVGHLKRIDISQLPPGVYFVRFGGTAAMFVKM